MVEKPSAKNCDRDVCKELRGLQKCMHSMRRRMVQAGNFLGGSGTSQVALGLVTEDAISQVVKGNKVFHAEKGT